LGNYKKNAYNREYTNIYTTVKIGSFFQDKLTLFI